MASNFDMNPQPNVLNELLIDLGKRLWGEPASGILAEGAGKLQGINVNVDKIKKSFSEAEYNDIKAEITALKGQHDILKASPDLKRKKNAAKDFLRDVEALKERVGKLRNGALAQGTEQRA